VDNREAGVALVAILHKVETDLTLPDRFVLDLIQRDDWSFERGSDQWSATIRACKRETG
jgi:hypothetical protein